MTNRGTVSPVIADMTTTTSDFRVTVCVRVYGEGTAADAARALEAYSGTFTLPNGDEVEIIRAIPSEDIEE